MSKKLQNAYKQYIDLLERVEKKTLSYLVAHGIYPSEKDIRHGRRLREKIAKLEGESISKGETQ